MLKKITLTITLITSIITCSAQEIILEFKNDLKTSSSKLKDVIPIVNKENGDIAMFLADAKNVYGYKFNKDFSLIDKLSSEQKRRKYKILIGNSISDDKNYTVYLTNKNKNTFLSVNFSFTNKNSTSKEFKLKLPTEKFIQTVSTNNKFYLISARKDTGAMYIYTFDKKGNYKRNRIDLTKLKFQLNTKRSVTAPYLLTFRRQEIKKVEENLPNSIEITADKEKIYVRENSIYFTFDRYNNTTQILKIDLGTFKATKEIYKKPLEKIKPSKKKSNSFINGNYLFLSATTKEKLVFRVIDFKTKEILKNYTILRDEPINFKNTPIIQEGGFYNGYREMEKTKKFLRKINKDKFGISARKVRDKYHTTIGGYVIQKSAGPMMLGGFGGIPIASIGNISIFFNPTMYAYNSMTNTKSTRIESLFDEDFNHIKGEVGKNIFDKIKDSDIRNIDGETVFKYKDYFINGYYKPNSKNYYLVKFTED